MAVITQAAEKAAKDVANAPAQVAVAGIQTVQNALDAVLALFNSGEASAVAILDVVKAKAPTLVEPLLTLLHLSNQAK